METVMNAYRVRVKKCCASCGLKEVDNDGKSGECRTPCSRQVAAGVSSNS